MTAAVGVGGKTEKDFSTEFAECAEQVGDLCELSVLRVKVFLKLGTDHPFRPDGQRSRYGTTLIRMLSMPQASPSISWRSVSRMVLAECGIARLIR